LRVRAKKLSFGAGAWTTIDWQTVAYVTRFSAYAASVTGARFTVLKVAARRLGVGSFVQHASFIE
jgi:hypothetical protein